MKTEEMVKFSPREMLTYTDLTQAHVARMLGIDPATFRRYLMRADDKSHREMPEPTRRLMALMINGAPEIRQTLWRMDMLRPAPTVLSKKRDSLIPS